MFYFTKRSLKLFLLVFFILNFLACKTFDFSDEYAKSNQDDTAIIQEMLNLAKTEITIPKRSNAEPYIVGPLKLKNLKDKKIIFEPGCIILAKAGQFKGENDCLLEISNCKNLKLIGFACSIEMRKDDYKSLGYPESKLRHAISISASSDVSIEGFSIARSGGDAIFIGNKSNSSDAEGSSSLVNKNIKLLHLNISNNYRCGIFVASVDDLLIESCSVLGNNGLISSDGLRFDIDENSSVLKNIRVKNSAFLFNKNSGIKINLRKAKKESFPINIIFENCLSDKNKLASFAVTHVPKQARGSITVINCNFKGFQYIREAKNLIFNTTH